MLDWLEKREIKILLILKMIYQIFVMSEIIILSFLIFNIVMTENNQVYQTPLYYRDRSLRKDMNL